MVVSYASTVEITEQNLASFRQWIMDRGRNEDTARLYATHLAAAAADKGGLTRRLVTGHFSPNYRHNILAALRAWALFSKDRDLADRLSDIRLPSARRTRHKPPLAAGQWKAVVGHLMTCRMRNEAMRQVLLLMALRGFRSGDVLRMQRAEIGRALDTGKLVYVGKGSKRLEFSVAPFRGQLEALYAMRGWTRVRDLITTSSNPRVASNKVWRAARRTAKQAGIPEMNPHRYRHTYATRFLDRLSGDPNAIVKLQKFMGWENMATAARYVDQVSQSELDDIGADLASGLVANPTPPAPTRRRAR